MSYKEKIENIIEKILNIQENYLERCKNIENQLPVNLKNDIQNHYNHFIIIDNDIRELKFDISLLKKLTRETKVEDIENGMDKLINELKSEYGLVGGDTTLSDNHQLRARIVSQLDELIEQFDIDNYINQVIHDRSGKEKPLPQLLIKFKEKK
jgi:hypothetical protein